MRAAVAGNQVRAFQSNQQAEGIVEAAYVAQAQPDTLALTSQWRLEFPRPKRSARLAQEERTLLGVVVKLLTRGTLSYTSPAIQDFIRAHSAWDAFPGEEVISALRAVAAEPTCPYEPGTFDSDEERQFAEWFRRQDSQWSIIEQVSFASLLDGRGGAGDERRVDFLLTSPGGNAVVVEIDGKQHEQSKEADAARDRELAELAQLAIRVIRVPVSEVRQGEGPNLDRVRKEVVGHRRAPFTDDAPALPVRLGKLAHQVQVTLIEAALGGWLPLEGSWRIGFEPPASDRVSPELALDLAQAAAEDCAELVRRVRGLYGRGVEPIAATIEADAAAPDIVLSFGDGEQAGAPAPRFAVRDICFPAKIAAPRPNAIPMNAESPDRESARYFLQYLFRKNEFRKGQWETIDRTLRGLDSIVLLATGGGKSIAFQLSALLRPGCCVVVDPIISLIEDQIDNLAKVGIDRCLEISSAVERKTRDATSERMGQYLFVYIAPERFQIKTFRDELRALTQSVPISEIAIDEAHCVSEWGHDFRTAYLRLGRNAREYCTSHGAVPPVVALTGTASRMVLKDMQLDLDIRDFRALVTPKSFDRPELEFAVRQARVGESDSTLDGFLKALPDEWGLSEQEFYRPSGLDTKSVIVFTSTINGPTGTEEVAGRLHKRLPPRVGTYSGSAPRGVTGDWNAVKKATARDFKHNALPLLVATSAYGMGIDKPNVRSTVHFGLPHSIESFYQESGRAGRDQERAVCAVVFAVYDSSARLLNPAVPIKEIVGTLDELPRNQQDDLHQALWFLTQSFKGIEEEQQRLAEVARRLGRIGEHGASRLNWNKRRKDDDKDMEKALHRLSILGVIDDYEKDHAQGEFVVHFAGVSGGDIVDKLCAYVSDYQSALASRMRQELEEQSDLPYLEFVIHASAMLIQFVYGHVEQARRRALQEMLLAAQDAAARASGGGEVLRGRVLRHLEWSEFDEVLDEVVESGYGGLDAISGALKQADTPAAVDSLLGSVARLLQSTPDQPGLLLVRGVTEALARNPNWNEVNADVQAGLTNIGAYAISSQEVIADGLVACIEAAYRGSAEIGMQVTQAIAAHDVTTRELAQLIMRRVAPGMAAPLAAMLVGRLTESLQQVNEAYHDKQQL